MGTRSCIILKEGELKFRGIYCHWDGYPSGVGRNLLLHYNTLKRVKALIALGSLSVLASKLAPPPGLTHTFDNSLDGVTIAYHRDRAEPWEQTKPIEGVSVLDVLGAGHWYSYIYLFEDNMWKYRSRAGRRWYPLTPRACDIKGSEAA